MNFGDAIEIMKADGYVSRHAWNGKRMYVFLENGCFPSGPRPNDIDGVDEKYFDIGDEDTGVCMPHLVMHSASGAAVIGWLASQTDILAEDWCEVIFTDDDEDHEDPEEPAPKIADFSPELESLLTKLGVLSPKKPDTNHKNNDCDCDICWLEDLIQQMRNA